MRVPNLQAAAVALLEELSLGARPWEPSLGRKRLKGRIHIHYRVSRLLVDLDWVDFDLGVSL